MSTAYSLYLRYIDFGFHSQLFDLLTVIYILFNVCINECLIVLNLNHTTVTCINRTLLRFVSNAIIYFFFKFNETIWTLYYAAIKRADMSTSTGFMYFMYLLYQFTVRYYNRKTIIAYAFWNHLSCRRVRLIIHFSSL